MLQRPRTPYDKGLAEANPLIFMVRRQEQNIALKTLIKSYVHLLHENKRHSRRHSTLLLLSPTPINPTPNQPPPTHCDKAVFRSAATC